MVLKRFLVDWSDMTSTVLHCRDLACAYGLARRLMDGERFHVYAIRELP
jgi:hypothetical protein